MKERNRRMMAAARSRKASPSELRQAQARVKELAQELKVITIRPETKQGENRESRYERVLRIRAMREQFEYDHPYNKRPHANSLMLSLVMYAASLALCLAMGLGTYFAYNFITSKPDPVPVVNQELTTLEQQDYSTFYNDLSASLRFTTSKSAFTTAAQGADTDYGVITEFSVAKDKSGKTQVTINGQNATVVYTITRGRSVKYNATIGLLLTAGNWGINDMGAIVQPGLAGVAPPKK